MIDKDFLGYKCERDIILTSIPLWGIIGLIIKPREE